MKFFALFFGVIASVVTFAVSLLPVVFHNEKEPGYVTVAETDLGKIHQKTGVASAVPVSGKKPLGRIKSNATAVKKTAPVGHGKEVFFSTPVIAPSLSSYAEEEKATKDQVAASSSFLPSANISPTTTAIIFPPLRVDEIFRAIVKIECFASDGVARYTGSGFGIRPGIVVTAAHLVKGARASDACTVIFPNNRKPIYYLKAVIEDYGQIPTRHDENGLDVAFLRLPPLENYADAKSIFADAYPHVPYPICDELSLIGDRLIHFGYPSNYVDQGYLSMFEGEATVFADIGEIKDQTSEDGTYTFKSPIFLMSINQEKRHPYLTSHVASYYGDSGGLAFDATKQCILGPHRGGTIGRDAGDNYTIFPLLSWPDIKVLLPAP